MPGPDAGGHYDVFGGKYVPEALYAALDQLDREYEAALADPAFGAELGRILRDFAGRPSPITELPKLSRHAGNARLVAKREDLLTLAELLATGQVAPVIDRTYTLDEAADALRHVAAGHTRGKVVVTV